MVVYCSSSVSCWVCLAIKTATAPMTAATMAMPINAVRKSGMIVALLVKLMAPVHWSLPDHAARIVCKPAVSAVQRYSKLPFDWVIAVPIMVQGELLTRAYSVTFSLGISGLS